MSPQPITIHQFHFSTSTADAVTNHMRLIRESLAENGIGGEIFSVENKATVDHRILPFEKKRLWNCDLLLIHHSHGNPMLAKVLELEIPKALVYHNVTPERFFPHDAYLQSLCRLGREQLKVLRDDVVHAFAVSEVNAQELADLGFDSIRLFPLIDLSNSAKSSKARPSKGRSRLLFVGKLTPHKNQKLLIETLFYLESAYPGAFDLQLIGRSDPLYGRYLKDLAKGLGLENIVHFSGSVTDSALERAYREATLFVCPSLHEGFCVPLVESMRAELPIAAIPVPGVRETLKNAGIRLMTRKPHRVAAIISAIVNNTEALTQLKTSGTERLEELKRFQNREQIRELCAGLVSDLRKSSARVHREKRSWFPSVSRVQNPA